MTHHPAEEPSPRLARWVLVVAAVAIAAVAIGGAVAVMTIRRESSTSSTSSSSCAGSVDLAVVSSPDQQQVLRGLAQQFERGKPRVGDRCVRLAVQAQDPATTAAALGSSGDTGRRPDVWAPDASTWVARVRANPAGAAVVPEDNPSLASSPVVLAMPRPMAEALGWPRLRPSWQQVSGLLANPRGWAADGHAGWGRVKIVMADPATDAAGLSALLSLLQHGGSGRLSDAQLVAALRLSHAVAMPAKSTARIFQQLRQADGRNQALAFASAFPATEQDVARYNAARPNVPMVAIYPAAGAPDADHPYVTLTARWVDAAKKAAAVQFLRFLRRPSSVRAYEKALFRSASGGPTSWLSKQEGVLRTATNPARAQPPSASVGTLLRVWKAMYQLGNTLAVIDTTGSMAAIVPGTGKTKLKLVQDASIRSLAIWRPQSIVGVWSLARRPGGSGDYHEMAPMQTVGPEGSARQQAAANAILKLRPSGETPLYNVALAAYLYALRNWKPGYVNIVVFLTDGRNEISDGLGLPQLITKLKEASNPARPIGFLTIAYGANADLDALRAITKAVGGQTFVARQPTDIDTVFVAGLIRTLSTAPNR